MLCLICRTANVILLMTASVLSCCAYADEFDIDQYMLKNGLKRFSLSDIPMEQLFKHEYYVSVDSNMLSLSHQYKNQNMMAITHGTIQFIGTNNGEWGGKLLAKIDGVEQELMSGNIVSLVPFGASLFVIDGLSHLSFSSGKISIVPDINKPGSPELITRLPDSPEVVYLDETRPDLLRIIIVGTQSIMSYDEYHTLSIMYWDAFWGFGLRPTSIVRFEDNYFIGLPHGVAVIPAPSGPSSVYCGNDSEYLPPNSCTYVRFYADSDFRSKFGTN